MLSYSTCIQIWTTLAVMFDMMGHYIELNAKMIMQVQDVHVSSLIVFQLGVSPFAGRTGTNRTWAIAAHARHFCFYKPFGNESDRPR
jgi:hypothetical protein